jgi:hypothetical protein
MIHVPMCLWCNLKEVRIVNDSDGSGFCSNECESEWGIHMIDDGGTFHDDEDGPEFEPQPDDCPEDEPWDGFRSDAEADADVLRSCGWGTDEDYGYYGEDE